MDEFKESEVTERKSYSLEGAVLTHGFKSNRQVTNEYILEKENIIKAIRSGYISSPISRDENNEYTNERYGVPIDAKRVCFYLWHKEEAEKNERTYAPDAVWVGPVSLLEGYSVHADPGVPHESIGVTSPEGNVTISFEKGKLLVTLDMFIDLYPEIVARSQALGIPLDQYLTENIYLINSNDYKDISKLTEIALRNITPAKNVTAKIEKLNISSNDLPGSINGLLTVSQLGISEKVSNEDWKELFSSFVHHASKSRYKDSRELFVLQVISELADQIMDEKLKKKTVQAINHCESLQPVSIFQKIRRKPQLTED